MPSAYDCTHLGSPSLLRSPARLEPPLFVGSMTRMGSFLFAFDGAFLDSLLFLRSFAHLDPSLFAPSFSSLGSLSLLRNVACLESSVSVFGMVRCASSPFAFDFLHLGPALFLRSLAQLGPSTSALDCLLADFSILLRSFMRPDFCLLPREILDMALWCLSRAPTSLDPRCWFLESHASLHCRQRQILHLWAFCCWYKALPDQVFLC